MKTNRPFLRRGVAFATVVVLLSIFYPVADKGTDFAQGTSSLVWLPVTIALAFAAAVFVGGKGKA